MPDDLKERLRNATARVIVRRRHEAGLSQERLAEIANLERTYLSFLERRLRTPGFETLVKLAGAFGIPVAQLVGEIEDELGGV